MALEREKFDYREWVALNWVRQFLLFEGEFPDRQVDDAFRTSYTYKEQRRIFAVFKLMFFFNRLDNSAAFRRSRRKKKSKLAPAVTELTIIDKDHK